MTPAGKSGPWEKMSNIENGKYLGEYKRVYFSFAFLSQYFY